MIGLSAASDEQAGILPEAMLGYDESHKMQIAFFFFYHSLRLQKLQTFFSSLATLLCHSLLWFFPVSVPTPFLYFQ